MLKKAGIVVAAAAAGLLAVSPLAFAGDKGHDVNGAHNGGDKAVNSVSDDSNTVGLVNVADNNVNLPVQALNCNDVPIQGGVLQGQVPIDNVTAAVTGALSLFGDNDVDSQQTTDNSCNSTQGDSSAGDSVLQGIER